MSALGIRDAIALVLVAVAVIGWTTAIETTHHLVSARRELRRVRAYARNLESSLGIARARADQDGMSA